MNNTTGSRVVMVTGATSGIGRAVATRFASASDQVVAVGRNAAVLADVATDIQQRGGNAITIQLDVTQDDEVQRVFAETIGQMGRLDVLVNAAGHIASGSIENTSMDAWDSMMNVNLRSVFRLMQLSAPHLIKTRGNVVNVSSVTGFISWSTRLLRFQSRIGSTDSLRGARISSQRSAR